MRADRRPLAGRRRCAGCSPASARRPRSSRQLAERSRPAYAQRLKARIEELLGGGPLDPARLAQEAALLAERADVSEELARLRSHVEQFDSLLDGAGELGKKLDFLLQEMQREANTLLSKTPGLGEDGLAITDLRLANQSGDRKIAGTSAERRMTDAGLLLPGSSSSPGPSGSGKSTLVERLRDAAGHDVFRFLHHAPAARDGKPRKML